MVKANLKLKKDVEPSVLLNYGFKPKYDVDTGKIIEYYRTFEIDKNHEKHFTFSCQSLEDRVWLKHIKYDAWMSLFEWRDIVTKECMELLYELIKDGVVETI